MDIKKADIKELREMGFLHEVNRSFFHPLGLALEVVIDEETGKESLGGIWDYRNDPEGILFDKLDKEKIKCWKTFAEKQHYKRLLELGYVVQKKDLNNTKK